MGGGYFSTNWGDNYSKGGCCPHGCGYNGFQLGLVGSGNLGGLSLWSELVGEFGGVNSGFGRLNAVFGGVGWGSAAVSVVAAVNTAAAAAAVAGQKATAVSGDDSGYSADASASAASRPRGWMAPFIYSTGYNYFQDNSTTSTIPSTVLTPTNTTSHSTTTTVHISVLEKDLPPL